MTMETNGAANNMGQRAGLRRFRMKGLVFWAKEKVDGVLINPKLPAKFDITANEDRPASHQKWWDMPYIETETLEDNDRYYAERTDQWAEEGRTSWMDKGRSAWLEAWPSGTRYAVHCLDGGAWDRPTSWGMFGALEEAIACAKGGPSWRR